MADQFVFANQSGMRPWRGAQVNFTVGEAWHADDPFVRAHPGLFTSTPPAVRGSAAATPPAPPAPERVERATRRPGERRA
jgi:hypothetical protein